MKTSFFTAMLLVMLTASLHSQHINNTLGNLGTFTIKDGSTTFMSLSQSTGYVTLNNSLTIPVTTSSTLGVIYKGANRFIHDYEVAGTAGLNTFVGINSGNFAMSGTILNASRNSAVGHSSLKSLTTGSQNSAFGYEALTSNTEGYNNSASGQISLRLNTTGSFNAAFGSQSLTSNTEGSNNSAFGFQALFSNTGSNNSAFGRNAGTDVITGSNNTCIGYNAQVPDGDANNQVRIGDLNVSYAGVQVAWTVTSDRKWKTNIAKSNLGLDFVSKLNAVSYTRKNDEKQRTEYGFIAQEIEEVLKEGGIENAGMLTIDDAGSYELRYNDLLAPMVKATQELKAENDALKERLAKLEGLFSSLENKFAER